MSTDESITEMMAAVRRLLESNDFDSALRLSEQCLELSADVRNPETRAGAIVTRGITLARINDYNGALPLFDAAIEIYESLGNELAAAKVRLNRVHCYSQLGRYSEALREGENSNSTFLRLGEKQLLARGLNNLGEVYFRLDRPQEWLNTLEKAGSLLEEIGDEKSLALVYMNHAVALTSLNRSDEARAYHQLSKNKAEATGQTWLAACGNYNLGYLHYTQGEYTRALNILNETRNRLAKDPWYGPLCDLTQSEIYVELNMPGEALHSADAAYRGFDSTHKPFEMAKALGMMAIAQSKLGHFAEAGRLFQQSKKMFKDQGNHVRAASMDLYRSVMWLHLRRYTEAHGLCRDAYETFMRENVKPKATFALVVSARASLALHNLDEAGRDVELATALHRESPQPAVGYQLYALSGEIQAANGNLEKACKQFEHSIGSLDDVRANIEADDLRLNYFKDKVPVYEMLLSARLRLGDSSSIRQAFETAEQAKSRTLIDLLAGSVESLKQAKPSSLEQIRRTLSPRTVLLEYVMTGEGTTVFCLSRERFTCLQNISSSAAVKKSFDLVQFQLSRLAAHPEAARARTSSALANVQDHLRALYEMLIAPLEDFLAETESIVLVPSGYLHYLPFHALFDGAAYLIDRFTISYAPSASIYQLFTRRTGSVFKRAVLIGAPDQNAPLIADEIESIASVIRDAKTFVGPAATRERLRNEIQTAGIVHIASHSTFRPDNPMFSSFQLHDGPINFFDVYDLRTAAGLITLSGCGTGLSSIVAGDELLGLIRGFLYAGATAIVLSLWDIHDRTTAELMKTFYGYLTEKQTIAGSLRSAMLDIRKAHPHPYYWAPFLLVGNPASSL